jgi:hypothetical protein
MLHLQNTMPYTPKHARALLQTAREIVESQASVRDARVSKKYIEFDISISDGADMKTIIAAIESIGPLAGYEEIVERQMEKDKAIARAVQLFNDERYWEAHEALEYVWKNATGVEREILNGIILVAAAFVHDEKDESDVCISILRRARKKLDPVSGNYHGININRIADMISEVINTGKVHRFTI